MPAVVAGDPLPAVKEAAHEEPDVAASAGRSWTAAVRSSVETATGSLFAFTNIEEIKEKVRAAKVKPNPYNVHNAYYTDGFFQWVAKHKNFENCTLSIIVINAFWISIDTDGNTADTMLDAETIFNVADSLFFIYFSIELFVRFSAFKRKLDCLKDGWFKFDGTLVFLYAFDPFTIALIAHMSGGGGVDLPTSVLRLFRLARLSRLVRMLRSLPELMIMIKGMLSATASVGYTLGLLLLITYVFAIALRNLVPSEHNAEDSAYELSIGEEYFSSVPEAMHNLIIFGTFLDALSDFVRPIHEQSTPCLILTWIYIALASLTVMNMLIGVLCEVISAVAIEERESMMVDKVYEKFGAIVGEMGKDIDCSLTFGEFAAMLDNPDTVKTLEIANVDAECLVDLAEDFFFEEGEPRNVSFHDFLGMVLDLRGGQEATVKDIMSLAKRFCCQKFVKMNGKVDGLIGTLDGMDAKVNVIMQRLKKRAGK